MHLNFFCQDLYIVHLYNYSTCKIGTFVCSMRLGRGNSGGAWPPAFPRSFNIYSYPVNLHFSRYSKIYDDKSWDTPSIFGGSHLRIRTNLYFCIKLIGRWYSFNEKIKFPKWLLTNSIIVPEHYVCASDRTFIIFQLQQSLCVKKFSAFVREVLF